MNTALKHFLERAAGDKLPRFEAWFPPCFDWGRLCGDVPRMAEKSGASLPEEEGDERELENMARSLFKAGHLFTLAVLAAGSAAEADPHEIFEQLTSAPSDEEEAVFEELLAGSLEAAESILSGEGGDGPQDEEAERAAALVGATWPAVEHLLVNDPSRMFERAGEAAVVLASMARLGALLAAFRWLAAERTSASWPDLVADA